MKGIMLGRASTDVLVVILWRFDRSGGIYRTWRWKPKSPALPRSNSNQMKSEIQTARSVCLSFIQFRYIILVSRLNEISHLSYSLGCLWMVWKVEEKLDFAKNIVDTRRENYKEAQLSATRDTLDIFWCILATARNFVDLPWSIDWINTVQSS